MLQIAAKFIFLLLCNCVELKGENSKCGVIAITGFMYAYRSYAEFGST